MRVAVLVIGGRREQAACIAQIRTDRTIGRVEFGVDDAALSGQPSPIIAVFAIGGDGENGFNAVRLAQVKVILAMIGGHMDKAGAGFGGDEG